MSLSKLIEAVEAGTATAYDCGLLFPLATNFEHTNAWDAYRGSLDAAKRLHDALLPGWMVECMCQLLEVGEDGEYTGGTDGWLVNLRHLPDGRSENSATADNPARAWLLALLRALEQEGRE